MVFVKNLARNDEKKMIFEHQTLGQRFIWPIVQANQRNVLQIEGF